MALPPEFDQPAWRALGRIDSAMSAGQARLFRVLWFMLPPQSIARNLHFQALLASRFLSDLALQALLFAALTATAVERSGGEGPPRVPDNEAAAAFSLKLGCPRRRSHRYVARYPDRVLRVRPIQSKR